MENISDKKETYRPIVTSRVGDHKFAVEYEMSKDTVIIKEALEYVVNNGKYPGQAVAMAIWSKVKKDGVDLEILEHGDSHEKRLLIDLYLQRFSIYGFLRSNNMDLYLDTILTIIDGIDEVSFEESVNVVIFQDVKEWYSEIKENIKETNISKDRLDMVNEAAKKHFTLVMERED